MVSCYFHSQQIRTHTHTHSHIYPSIKMYKKDSDFSKLFFYHIFKWSNASLLSHMRMLRRNESPRDIKFYLKEKDRNEIYIHIEITFSIMWMWNW